MGQDRLTSPAALNRAFVEIYGDSDGARFGRAPGRVNLLGDHTDYNDGFVLPMTIDRVVAYVLRRRTDGTVKLRSLNFDDDLAYPLTDPSAVEPGHWSSYVVGVVDELRNRGLLTAGFEGVVAGDVPLGGVLSSSAALEIATVTALQNVFGFELDGVGAAKLGQHVEHHYAGVQCGIMDQFASRLGRTDHALFLDCRDLTYEHIPLVLGPVNVVIVDTGVSRALAGSKYNQRRHECAEGVTLFERLTGTDVEIRTLRDVSPALFERHAADLPEPVRRRCRHVVFENERVVAAKQALRAGRLDELGQLMNASHASLRDLYEVSCPELDALAEIGQSTEGVFGARMTGGGFGGCTVHLVEATAVPTLEARIFETYPARFERTPTVHVLRTNLEAG